MENELLTVEEVAALLKVSTETVRRYLRSGELKGQKLKRAWRVRREELRRFLRDNAPHPTRKTGYEE